MPTTFVLDANVLYSARLRDLWLQLGVIGAARIAWTDAIEAEWTAALERTRPELHDLVRRTAQAMRTHLPDAYVRERDLPPLEVMLPDPSDVHVVRAALAVEGAIVTFNLDDFPNDLMERLNVSVLTPDDAILHIAATDEEGVLAAANAIRMRLRAPPVSTEAFTAGFARAGCPQFSAWLSARLSRL